MEMALELGGGKSWKCLEVNVWKVGLMIIYTQGWFW